MGMKTARTVREKTLKNLANKLFIDVYPNCCASQFLCLQIAVTTDELNEAKRS
jgi:hypothetical protein